MKNNFWLVLALLISKFANCQLLENNDYFFFLDTPSTTISLYSNYSVLNNSFSGKFINYLRNNKYLSNDVKNTNYYRNQFFSIYNWHNTIDYYIQPDSLFGTDENGLHISLAYSQFSSAIANKELIKLLLYGNKQYTDSKVLLSNTVFQYLNYATFSLGIYKNYEANTFFFKGIFDLNLHVFREFQSIFIKDGHFYTANDGVYLDLYLKGKYLYSRQLNPALSFNMGMQVFQKDWLMKFAFEIKRLGFLMVRKKGIYSNIDTTLHFEGIEIQNILNNVQFENNMLNNDSLKNYYLSFVDTGTYYYRLPEVTKITVSKLWKHNFLKETYLGIYNIYDLGKFLPELYAAQVFKFFKNSDFTMGFSYIRFSNINPYTTITFNYKKWVLKFQYSNFISLINKNKPYNNCYMVQLIRSF